MGYTLSPLFVVIYLYYEIRSRNSVNIIVVNYVQLTTTRLVEDFAGRRAEPQVRQGLLFFFVPEKLSKIFDFFLRPVEKCRCFLGVQLLKVAH